MITRRTFIKPLAAIPPIVAFRHGWAANPNSPDPSRLALIIGNSSYREAPLVNPVNDAKAVGGLLTQAGFTVDSHLNATRTDMMAAIERFGTAIKRSETKLVVFYYAGHGAQLDWRNYLLPVDAVVASQEDIKQRCVDLGLLLGQLNSAKDKTFIVILDACRNNPFGRSYRPEQKGLSQFDAPVGSLLAYATSPGNVASDGEGQNGLYTENLVRELSRPATRIEDALKRVRLNVRLASHGSQIPWETTSLESDVFIFNEGQKKLTEAEQEKLIEADFAEWGRIKSSLKVDDWVAYLRTFPNGRFAEIAQTRLTRLLAEREKPVPAAAPIAPTPVAAPMPMIELAQGTQAPQFLQLSVNPNSVGSYPLARKFSVGDRASYVVSDLLTGVEKLRGTYVITRVDEDADRVEANNGKAILDLMGNFVLHPRAGLANGPRQWTPAEFFVGKKWKFGYIQQHPQWGEELLEFDARIAALEKVRVPAGEFSAFRIDLTGWSRNSSGYSQGEVRHWLVPGLNFFIKDETLWRQQGRLTLTLRTELVSARQQTFDIACTTATGGLHRTLVIKSSCA